MPQRKTRRRESALVRIIMLMQEMMLILNSKAELFTLRDEMEELKPEHAENDRLKKELRTAHTDLATAARVIQRLEEHLGLKDSSLAKAVSEIKRLENELREKSERKVGATPDYTVSDDPPLFDTPNQSMHGPIHSALSANRKESDSGSIGSEDGGITTPIAPEAIKCTQHASDCSHSEQNDAESLLSTINSVHINEHPNEFEVSGSSAVETGDIPQQKYSSPNNMNGDALYQDDESASGNPMAGDDVTTTCVSPNEDDDIPMGSTATAFGNGNSDVDEMEGIEIQVPGSSDASSLPGTPVVLDSDIRSAMDAENNILAQLMPICEGQSNSHFTGDVPIENALVENPDGMQGIKAHASSPLTTLHDPWQPCSLQNTIPSKPDNSAHVSSPPLAEVEDAQNLAPSQVEDNSRKQPQTINCAIPVEDTPSLTTRDSLQPRGPQEAAASNYINNDAISRDLSSPPVVVTTPIYNLGASPVGVYVHASSMENGSIRTSPVPVEDATCSESLAGNYLTSAGDTTASSSSSVTEQSKQSPLSGSATHDTVVSMSREDASPTAVVRINPSGEVEYHGTPSKLLQHASNTVGTNEDVSLSPAEITDNRPSSNRVSQPNGWNSSQQDKGIDTDGLSSNQSFPSTSDGEGGKDPDVRLEALVGPNASTNKKLYPTSLDTRTSPHMTNTSSTGQKRLPGVDSEKLLSSMEKGVADGTTSINQTSKTRKELNGTKAKPKTQQRISGRTKNKDSVPKTPDSLASRIEDSMKILPSEAREVLRQYPPQPHKQRDPNYYLFGYSLNEEAVLTTKKLQELSDLMEKILGCFPLQDELDAASVQSCLKSINNPIPNSTIYNPATNKTHVDVLDNWKLRREKASAMQRLMTIQHLSGLAVYKGVYRVIAKSGDAVVCFPGLH